MYIMYVHALISSYAVKQITRICFKNCKFIIFKQFKLNKYKINCTQNIVM